MIPKRNRLHNARLHGPCHAPRRSRSHTIQAFAAQKPTRRPPSTANTPINERILETAEVAGLVFAASSLFSTAMSARPPATTTSTTTSTGDLSTTTLYITAPLFIAVAARTILSRVSRKRAQSTPAAQAMSRLAAAEATISTHADAVTTLSRQLDKLQTRTRLVSRDVREQLKGNLAATAAQGEILGATNGSVVQLEQDVRDVELLVGAVQEVVAKQFGLLSTIIQQQQQQHEKTKSSSSSSGIDRKKGGKTSSSPSSSPGVAGAAEEKGKDEWGRSLHATLNNGGGGGGTGGKSDSTSTSAILPSLAMGSNGSEGDGKGKEPTTSSSYVKQNDDGSVSYSF